MDLKNNKTIKWSTQMSASEILHSLPDAVFTTDRQMRINYFNLAASVITGFKPQEALGMYCKDVLKSNICETECLVKRAIDSRQNIFNVETVVTTANGEKISSLVNASLLADPSGEVVGYMYVFRNIMPLKKMMSDLEHSRNKLAETNKQLKQEIVERKRVEEALQKARDNLEQKVRERTAELMSANQQLKQEIEDRKQAEEALRKALETTETILEQMPVGIVVVDKDKKILKANNTALKIMTRAKEDVVGKTCHRNICPSDEGKCPVWDLGNKFDNSERVVLGRDGIHIPVLKTVLPVFIGGEDVLLEAFVDITERKRAEEEKEKLQTQLQQARKMESIGTLAGGIAHDFNNLLAVIHGNAQLMSMDLETEHSHYELVHEIEDRAKVGANLTKQLLAFARGGKYEVKPIDLNNLIETSSNTFGRTKKEITIHRKFQKDLSPIKADRSQIEQILMNLYVNAAYAMPGGGDLYLETRATIHEDIQGKPFHIEPGSYILLSVRDTGVGMDKKTQERVFDPFFTTKEMGRGTGLGLASVYGIIKSHKGYIEVESEKDQGANFKIYLPVSEEGVDRPVKIADQVVTGTETILLVDDEEAVLKLGVRILQRLGYTALEAASGREAVEIYGNNKDMIDLVILDMIMPDVGGSKAYDLLKRINPGIKVLLSSGYSVDGQATEILERGCNGFIQKPFDIEALSHKIRDILEKDWGQTLISD